MRKLLRKCLGVKDPYKMNPGDGVDIKTNHLDRVHTISSKCQCMSREEIVSLVEDLVSIKFDLKMSSIKPKRKAGRPKKTTAPVEE